MPGKSDNGRGQSVVVPGPVARAAEVMFTYPHPWALCGGWAVDACLGRVTREHGDVDVAIFDQQALFQHLAAWQLIAHEEGKENQGVADLWDGRPLVLPAHAHGRSPEETGPLPERFDEAGNRIVFPEDGFWFDAPFCERLDGDWVLNREPRVVLPLTECIRQSAWDLPTVAPDVILFFKATLYVGTKNHLRPHDEADFLALLPLLTEGQREWLREAISGVYDGDHPWVGEI